MPVDRSFFYMIRPIGVYVCGPFVHFGLPRPPPPLSLDLVRRTGDGGHLFRRVLALRQRSALRRVKLQPSVVAVYHHRAKSKELCKEKGIRSICRKKEREKALA